MVDEQDLHGDVFHREGLPAGHADAGGMFPEGQVALRRQTAVEGFRFLGHVHRDAGVQHIQPAHVVDVHVGNQEEMGLFCLAVRHQSQVGGRLGFIDAVGRGQHPRPDIVLGDVVRAQADGLVRPVADGEAEVEHADGPVGLHRHKCAADHPQPLIKRDFCHCAPLIVR